MTSLTLAILSMISGICSGQWGVDFISTKCALRGTSVDLDCSFSYPWSQRVTTVMWLKGKYKHQRWEYELLQSLPSYQHRFQYQGDKRSNCSLRITNITDMEIGNYFFRFLTNKNQWTSQKYHQLSVAGLTASITPSPVTVGGTVALTCVYKCSPFASSTLVWYRDGQPVLSPTFQAKVEDAGNYQCAFEQQGSIRSAAVSLDVQYPPENVSISMDAPAEIVSGLSVNMTCSSTANPAVNNYTWYRRTGTSGSGSLVQIGSGKVMSLPSLEPSQSGHYICQARNSVGHSYSSELLLEVKGQDNLFVFLFARVGPIFFVLPALVLLVLYFCRKQRKRCGENQQVVSAADSGTENLNPSSKKVESLYVNSSHVHAHKTQVSVIQHKSPPVKSEDSRAVSELGEIIYSTVTVRPRETKASHYTESTAREREDTRTPGKEEEQVIYSNVSSRS